MDGETLLLASDSDLGFLIEDSSHRHMILQAVTDHEIRRKLLKSSCHSNQSELQIRVNQWKSQNLQNDESESDSESESSFVNKPNTQVNDPFTQPVPKINAPPIRKMSNPTISPNSFNAPTLQSSFGNLTINPSPPTNSQAKNIFDDEFAAIANR